MPSLERVCRGLLALTVAGTIPLSIWGSGCNSQPLVQPDASGQGGSSATGGVPGTGGVPATGGVPGTGGVLASGGVPGTGGLGGIGGHSSGGSNGAGGSQPRDASADALAQCCLPSQNGIVQCSADGRQRKTCGALYGGAMPECFMGSYSYVWMVLEECPNGCVDPGTGGQPGTGGVSVPICREPRDASGDASSLCCSVSQSNHASCSADGHQLTTCAYRLTSGANAQCAIGGSYGYIWQVLSCPTTCSVGGDAAPGWTCN